MMSPRRPCFPAFSDDKVLRARECDRVSIRAGLEIDIATSLVVLGVVLAASELIASKLKVREIGTGGTVHKMTGLRRRSDELSGRSGECPANC